MVIIQLNPPLEFLQFHHSRLLCIWGACLNLLSCMVCVPNGQLREVCVVCPQWMGCWQGRGVVIKLCQNFIRLHGFFLCLKTKYAVLSGVLVVCGLSQDIHSSFVPSSAGSPFLLSHLVCCGG